MARKTIGKLMFQIEDIVTEMVEDHELQKGEILALISGYIDIHLPGAIEEYEDGSSPMFFYGAPETLDQIFRKKK